MNFITQLTGFLSKLERSINGDPIISVYASKTDERMLNIRISWKIDSQIYGFKYVIDGFQVEESFLSREDFEQFIISKANDAYRDSVLDTIKPSKSLAQ